jgi:hypothetical protein
LKTAAAKYFFSAVAYCCSMAVTLPVRKRFASDSAFQFVVQAACCGGSVLAGTSCSRQSHSKVSEAIDQFLASTSSYQTVTAHKLHFSFAGLSFENGLEKACHSPTFCTHGQRDKVAVQQDVSFVKTRICSLPYRLARILRPANMFHLAKIESSFAG